MTARAKGAGGRFITESEEIRFWRRVEKTDGCWIWTGAKDRDGYGQFWNGAQMEKAHRSSWRFAGLTLSSTLTLDHLCRNHSCVRPDHLEQVTNRENQLRGQGWAALNYAKTHCVHGHPLSGENLRLVREPYGGYTRRCRACAKRYKANGLERRRVAVRERYASDEEFRERAKAWQREYRKRRVSR